SLALVSPLPPISRLFPYTTLFRSRTGVRPTAAGSAPGRSTRVPPYAAWPRSSPTSSGCWWAMTASTIRCCTASLRASTPTAWLRSPSGSSPLVSRCSPTAPSRRRRNPAGTGITPRLRRSAAPTATTWRPCCAAPCAPATEQRRPAPASFPAEAGGGDALDDLALEEQEHHDQWQRTEDCHGHVLRVLDPVGADDGLQPRRQGHQGRVVDHDEGPLEVVPRPDEHKDRHRRQDRPGQRQHDGPEHPHAPCAVDPGGILEFDGHLIEELL